MHSLKLRQCFNIEFLPSIRLIIISKRTITNLSHRTNQSRQARIRRGGSIEINSTELTRMHETINNGNCSTRTLITKTRYTLIGIRDCKFSIVIINQIYIINKVSSIDILQDIVRRCIKHSYYIFKSNISAFIRNSIKATRNLHCINSRKILICHSRMFCRNIHIVSSFQKREFSHHPSKNTIRIFFIFFRKSDRLFST